MMAQTKIIYILMILSPCFLKVIGNMFSVFLSSYRNTPESLRELEKAVETLTWANVPTAFLIFLNFHLCFYYM